MGTNGTRADLAGSWFRCRQGDTTIATLTAAYDRPEPELEAMPSGNDLSSSKKRNRQPDRETYGMEQDRQPGKYCRKVPQD
jgi:hypothetical protein